MITQHIVIDDPVTIEYLCPNQYANYVETWIRKILPF
ncbi:hypothetical protein FHR29_002887 [Sphingobacterium sp. JUb56]|nr:hypothetical protein [Sphingobacterium sp. JUb56]